MNKLDYKDIFVRSAPFSIPSGVRAARVFVSSPFRDMHADRTILMKEVFPVLRKSCQEIEVDFSFVDLRWGITNEQAAKGKVLPVCLAEIERCQPFFIGLIGQYYGTPIHNIPENLFKIYPWLEGATGLSVTDIEISWILEDLERAKLAFFYLRNSDYLDRQPQDIQCKWRSAGSDAKLLCDLVERIRTSGAEVTSYNDPVDLRDLVTNHILNRIKSLHPPISSIDSTHLYDEDRYHRAFACQHTRNYVVNQRLFEEINLHVQSYGSPPLAVEGDIGCGKSALLANWIEVREVSLPKIAIFSHFVGATATSEQWENLLRRLIQWANKNFSLKNEIPASPDELINESSNAIRAAAAQSSILIVVDGASELKGPEGIPAYAWMPDDFPVNVSFLLSVRSSSEAMEIVRQRGFQILKIKGLCEPERELLTTTFLDRVGKRLDDADLKLLVSNSVTAMPLFLRIILQELCFLGDRHQVSESIVRYLGSNSLTHLYSQVFRRWENDYGVTMVKRSLSLIAASQSGLPEQDLLFMASTSSKPIDSVTWSPFFLSAEMEISLMPGILYITNSHVRNAIESIYLSEAMESESRKAIIAFYQAVGNISITYTGGFVKKYQDLAEKLAYDIKALSGRAHKELPWQFAETEDWQGLMEYIARKDYIEWCSEFCPWVMTKWCEKLAEKGFGGDAFKHHLQQGASSIDLLLRIGNILTLFGDHESAEQAYISAERELDSRVDYLALGRAYLDHSAMLRSNGKFGRAVNCLKKSIDAFKKAKNEVGEACAKTELGVVYFNKNRTRKAKKLFIDALPILQRHGRAAYLATLYNCLGVTYGRRGTIQKGRDYLKRSEMLFKTAGNYAGVGEARYNLGVIEAHFGSKEKSLAYFDQAIFLYKSIGEANRAAKIVDVRKKVAEMRPSIVRKLFFGVND